MIFLYKIIIIVTVYIQTYTVMNCCYYALYNVLQHMFYNL